MPHSMAMLNKMLETSSDPKERFLLLQTVQAVVDQMNELVAQMEVEAAKIK